MTSPNIEKTIVPGSDFKWISKTVVSTTDNAKHNSQDWLKQTKGNQITIDASNLTTKTIDYSKSIFDNTLDASASTTVNKIIGGTGSDHIKGANIKSTLIGNSAVGHTDEIFGGSANDLIIGGKGADNILGGLGSNTLTGGTGSDTFSITGTDNITDLGLGTRNVTGFGTNDDLFVNSDATVTATLAGNWTPSSVTKNQGTVLILDKGNFTVDLSKALLSTEGFTIDASKSSKAVTLTGSLNADTINSGAGNDTINGGAGNDTIYGGKGNDSIDGGAGNDTIYGGAGKNSLTSGEGADTFVYLKGDGVSTITDFATGDKLQISVTAFKGLTVGAISESSFISNATGLSDSADHKFIFNTTNGNLYYDVDGSATHSKPVLIETIGTANPQLTYTDISIIA